MRYRDRVRSLAFWSAGDKAGCVSAGGGRASALVIGEKRARELILTGEIIDAVEAGRLGLCNHVVPGAHLEPKLLEVLAKLRELSGTSLGFARQSLDLGRGRSIEDALERAGKYLSARADEDEDANEGVKAFMEKRKAVWRHR
jgi:enoyl-CoA hydratase